MPTARSSANLTKPNPTPTRHTLTKDKIILQTATPQAASSQRIHISRTQGRGRTHPVTGRVTTQCLHTQSVTTCRRCGRNNKQEDPREQSAHKAVGIAANKAESKCLCGPQGGGGGGTGGGEDTGTAKIEVDSVAACPLRRMHMLVVQQEGRAVWHLRLHSPQALGMIFCACRKMVS